MGSLDKLVAVRTRVLIPLSGLPASKSLKHRPVSSHRLGSRGKENALRVAHSCYWTLNALE